MSLYATDSRVGYMHADADELGRRLREGDGILWAGDPDLSLHVGVITQGTGASERIVARRYEVWRHCEDGQDRMLGHWLYEEKDQIIADLAIMRGALMRPSDVTAASERIDAADTKREKAEADAFVDSMGAAMEHALKLDLDRSSHEAKTTFRGIPGLRDEPKLREGFDGSVEAV